MATRKNTNADRRKNSRKKVFTWVALPVAALVGLIVLLVPVVVSSRKGEQIILAKINDGLDGQLHFADLSMGWRSGIRITDITFEDAPGQISLAVKQITTKPHYSSILFARPSFGKTVIDQPRVRIDLRAGSRKKRDVSTAKPTPATAQAPAMLPVRQIDLFVNNGNVRVTDGQSRTVVLDQINSRVNLRPAGDETTFRLDAAVVDGAGASKVSASGRAVGSAQNGWTLQGTTGEITVDVNQLALDSLGPVFALAGIDIDTRGVLTASLTGEIEDGTLESLIADVKGTNLDVSGAALKGDRVNTQRLDLVTELRRRAGLIHIDKLNLQSDWLSVEATGTIPATYTSISRFVSTDSPYVLNAAFDCNLVAACSQLPKTLGLQEQLKVTSGKLTGRVDTITDTGRKRILGIATLAEVAATSGQKHVELSQPFRLETQVTAEKGIVKYEKLNLTAPFARINCRGTSDLLQYTAEADLAKLQSELRQFIKTGQYRIAGKFSSQGNFASGQGETVVTGSSQIQNLRLAAGEQPDIAEPTVSMAFKAAIERPKGILRIDSAELTAGFGRVGIMDGLIPLGRELKRQTRLPVSFSTDLQKLQPIAAALKALPAQMQLSGTAEGNVSITVVDHTYQLQSEAVKVKDLKLAYPGKEPFQPGKFQLSFDAEIEPAKQSFNLRRFTLTSPHIKIHKTELSKSRKGDKISLNLHSQYEYDWAYLGSLVSLFLPAGINLEGQRQETLDVSGEYPVGLPEQMLANLTARAGLGFEKAEYMGLNFGAAEVRLHIDEGILKIPPFSSTVNNGRFRFAAEVNLNQKPAMMTLPEPMQIMENIEINDRTAKNLLMYVNPIFANAVNVSGVGDFHCERLKVPLQKGKSNDLEVTGTIGIKQMRLQASDLLGQILSLAGIRGPQESLFVHPTRFVLQDEVLRYDDMQIDVGDNPLNFSGAVGLDKSLDMSVTLPYTTTGHTVKVGEEARGQRIVIPLKGTVNKPQLDTGKLLELQLKDQLQQRLKEKVPTEILEGLQDLFK